MKLAEALLERKAKQQKIADLESRILGCCTYQEGAEPPEDAARLIADLQTAYSELAELVKRINRTNSLTRVAPDGKSSTQPDVPGEPLSDLIVERDLVVRQQISLKRVANTVRANLSGMRTTRSEIRLVTRIDVGALEAQVNALGEKARRLDAAIQGLNWTVDLL